MCRSRSKTKTKKAIKSISEARAELLRFHKTAARFNAAIRRGFPPSHRIARAMERNTSGLINDAPGEAQSCVAAPEDACYCCCPEEAPSFNDGVSEAIEEARVWAGRPRIRAYGEFQYPARVSWVERALAVEVAAAAKSFFGSVYCLPGACIKHLRAEDKSRMHKHAVFMWEFAGANLLLQQFPGGICRAIIEFIV